MMMICSCSNDQVTVVQVQEWEPIPDNLLVLRYLKLKKPQTGTLLEFRNLYLLNEKRFYVELCGRVSLTEAVLLRQPDTLSPKGYLEIKQYCDEQKHQNQ
jgi:hypothetical protein